MEANHPEIGKDIAKTKEISEKTEKALQKAIKEFKELNYTELYRHEIK